MNSNDSQNSWHDYPMGPNVRSWLEVPTDSYSGQTRGAISSEEKQKFGDFLLEQISSLSVGSESQLIELMDELVAMDLPYAVLSLVKKQNHIWQRTNFRGLLAEGVAAMQTAELGQAEECFKDAQHIMPEEPAPYVNLVQIMSHDERYSEALTWCLAGLSAEPNNYNLWDQLAFLKQSDDESNAYQFVLETAKSKKSWAGFSMAADLDETANSQTKAGLLDGFYNDGEKSNSFLIEYTGALGAAGDYEKIPTIIWQAEKLSSSQLPWQLEIHAVQSYLAMEQLDQFTKFGEKFLSRSDIPEAVRAQLLELIESETQTKH